MSHQLHWLQTLKQHHHHYHYLGVPESVQGRTLCRQCSASPKRHVHFHLPNQPSRDVIRSTHCYLCNTLPSVRARVVQV
ncbi:hypothetical protein BCR41DRAFT_353729 [Lobosporangium transversale]|uniref:Uncharacterized protein n=1 Tax=Lobosporangium transversale TaxID=64571 RepID=A0A1Y2GM33_9FUNG|nr:hypothetical protein BCR41DRAFT_353729 [Lobosporangium transversale]ORZ15418.1 hypothetical protein BCR41DRAFT_353729 [Lobosporangium transversale]|eukprot:XP_021881166.1 hypothetical protein BCR41DRAFT_353729 [Lobosporangium transversale]